MGPRRWNCRITIAGAGLAALVLPPLFTVVIASERPSMEQMIAKADRWFFENGAKYSGPIAKLPTHLLEGGAAPALLEIYSSNWPGVAAHADRLLANLPVVAANSLGRPESVLSLKDAEPLKFAELSRGEGTLLAMRLFDPTALGNLGYSMLAGSKITAEEFGRNTVIGGFVSRKTFRTTLGGAPAVGVSSGFWTVVTAYTRSEHGLLVPMDLAMFKRSNEGK